MPKRSNLKLAAEAKKTTPLVEIGTTGLHRQGGFVFEEWLPQLRGTFWIKVVREMSENDPVIGAILRAIEMLTRQVEFRVDPGTEDNEGMADAQFVEECRTDMSCTWQDVMSEVLSMLPWGYCWLEQVYKTRNGSEGAATSKYSDQRLGWRKWSIRSQDSLAKWEFDDEGGIQAFVQRSLYGFTEHVIPIEKSLLFRTTSKKNNPQGYSLLRSAFIPWYRKINIERIEGIGIERDLAGYPVMRIPSDIMTDPAHAATYQNYKDMVTNIRRDELEGAILPSDVDDNGKELYSLELLGSAGTRQLDTDKIVTRYNTQIAMSMLADFMMLGHEQVGSFALASSKTNLFTTALGAYLDSICEVINRYAIPRLMRLNGRPADNTPKLMHGDVETVDLAELGKFVNDLSGAGFTEHLFPDVQHAVMKQARLPVPAEEDRQNAPESEPKDSDLELD